MEEGEYVPFAQRPEWADVQPVPQDDGPQGGVCAIAYSPQCMPPPINNPILFYNH
jgi:protein farnesyltransferase/geranylgeranyltransferase type-1 subunit alpha